MAPWKHGGLDDGKLRLGVMEAEDVGEVAELFASSFPPFTVAEDGNDWENAALRGVATISKAYDAAEYGLSLRGRCGARLQDARLDKGDDPGSVVLAVGAPEVVAAVEIRLRDVDPDGPNPLPIFDHIQRTTARARGSKPLLATPRPYISNVCVSPAYRRRGIAKVLLAASEFLVGPDVWGYDAVFLHVHQSNPPALALYQDASGYHIINHPPPRRDDEPSSGDPLLFLYKPLRPDAPEPEVLRQRWAEERSRLRRRVLTAEDLGATLAKFRSVL